MRDGLKPSGPATSVFLEGWVCDGSLIRDTTSGMGAKKSLTYGKWVPSRFSTYLEPRGGPWILHTQARTPAL